MVDTLLSSLTKILGPENVILGDGLNDRYDHVWNMEAPLKAKAVVIPFHAEQISEIMASCNACKQPVIIHGGLTNLVGSTESTIDDLVISMEMFNSILEVDKSSRTMTVQSGVILQNIQEAAQSNDLFFPLNFGAKGSAQIGGCISTNAGGLRVLRYGMTRNLVLGLEVVLPDGTILSSIKKILKDNSAYDLKQLFIGSEGTLGIVTKAVLRLQELPKSRNSAFVAFNDFEKIINFLKFIDKGLSGALSGFELIWKSTFQKLTTPPSLLKAPMPYDYNFYVLIESLGADQMKDKSIMQNLIEQALENELIEDGILADSEADLNWFWNIREDVGVIDNAYPASQHFDVSLPIPEIGDYVDKVILNLKTDLNITDAFAFGHMADGNIHFIIGKDSDDKKLREAINDIIYSPLTALKGSVSAEHGIGLHKKHKLPICRTAEEIQTMKLIKRTLDPNNILNRGKVLDI